MQVLFRHWPKEMHLLSIKINNKKLNRRIYRFKFTFTKSSKGKKNKCLESLMIELGQRLSTLIQADQCWSPSEELFLSR
jgi:hypothetical protein